MTIPHGHWDASIQKHSTQRFRHRRMTMRGVSRQKALASYTRQLANLLKAGVPIVKGLRMLAKQYQGGELGYLILDQIRELEEGKTFSHALDQESGFYGDMYVRLVEAGERAGLLAPILERLATYIESRIRIQGKIRSAMTYPLVVLIASCVIVAALLVFVVPQFEAIFETMLKGAPLPTITALILNISKYFQGYWVVSVVLFCVVVVLCKGLWGVPQIRRNLDYLLLILPFVGELVVKSQLARFSHTFSMMLASDIPVLISIRTASQSVGNSALRLLFSRIELRVLEGDSIAIALGFERVLPPLFVGMVGVGEEIGELSLMLTEIAHSFEQEVSIAVDGMTTILEPLLILLLAFVVGILVLSLFLPIVQIMEHLGS